MVFIIWVFVMLIVNVYFVIVWVYVYLVCVYGNEKYLIFLILVWFCVNKKKIKLVKGIYEWMNKCINKWII